MSQVQEERKSPHPDVMGKKKNNPGNDGTPDVVKSYANDTPGQPIPRHLTKFKDFVNK